MKTQLQNIEDEKTRLSKEILDHKAVLKDAKARVQEVINKKAQLLNKVKEKGSDLRDKLRKWHACANAKANLKLMQDELEALNEMKSKLQQIDDLKTQLWKEISNHRAELKEGRGPNTNEGRKTEDAGWKDKSEDEGRKTKEGQIEVPGAPAG